MRQHHLSNMFLSLISSVPSDLILLVFNSPAASCPHPWPIFQFTLSHFPHVLPITPLSPFPSSISSWWSTVSPSVGGFPLTRHWLLLSLGRCAADVKNTPPKYTSASLKYTSDRSLESACWPGQLSTGESLTPDQTGSKLRCIETTLIKQSSLFLTWIKKSMSNMNYVVIRLFKRSLTGRYFIINFILCNFILACAPSPFIPSEDEHILQLHDKIHCSSKPFQNKNLQIWHHYG